jgi:glycosyltransferase involved in cell wall biosynthesis
LIKALDNEKFDIEILTTYRDGLSYLEHKDGYKIIRIGGRFFGANGYLTKVGRLYFSIIALFYNLINNKFDVINFIGVGITALPSIIVARMLNKRLINKTTAVGDDDPIKLSNYFIGRYILKLLEKNTFHWIISQEIYDNCIKYTKWKKENLFLITNPVEVIYKPYNFLLKQRNKHILKDEITFLFVGVLDKRKGLDVLLELWIKYQIDAKLILCGPRGKDNDINALLDNVDDTTIIELGPLGREEIKNQYLTADFFIFPSRREGLPNVILEAMSFGLPIISNNIPGVTDYLLGAKKERGIIVNNNDIKIWLEIINNIVNLENSYNFTSMSENAYEWIMDNSEAKVVSQKIEKLYTKRIK